MQVILNLKNNLTVVMLTRVKNFQYFFFKFHALFDSIS
jgi:hypothetical protein